MRSALGRLDVTGPGKVAGIRQSSPCWDEWCRSAQLQLRDSAFRERRCVQYADEQVEIIVHVIRINRMPRGERQYGARRVRGWRGTRLHPRTAAAAQAADFPGRSIEQEHVGHKVDVARRSEEHTSELQSRRDLVCRLLLEKK